MKSLSSKITEALQQGNSVNEAKIVYKITKDTSVEDSKIGNKFYNVAKGEKVELIDDNGEIAKVKLSTGEIVNIESNLVSESVSEAKGDRYHLASALYDDIIVMKWSRYEDTEDDVFYALPNGKISVDLAEIRSSDEKKFVKDLEAYLDEYNDENGTSFKFDGKKMISESVNEAKQEFTVHCYDDSYQFASTTDKNEDKPTSLDAAHKYGQEHCTRDGMWYTIQYAGSRNELIDQRTKRKNGKFITGYLKENVNEAKSLTFKDIIDTMEMNGFAMTKITLKKWSFVSPSKKAKGNIEHTGKDTVTVTDKDGNTEWSFESWLDEVPMFQYESKQDTVKAKDLKENSTYFMNNFEGTEAYVQFVGKEGSKYLFDNSGRKYRLTEKDVEQYITLD